RTQLAPLVANPLEKRVVNENVDSSRVLRLLPQHLVKDLNRYGVGPIAIVLGRVMRTKVIADTSARPFSISPPSAVLVRTAMRRIGISDIAPRFAVAAIRLRDIAACRFGTFRAWIVRIKNQLCVRAFACLRVCRHIASREWLALAQVSPQFMNWRPAFRLCGWPARV